MKNNFKKTFAKAFIILMSFVILFFCQRFVTEESKKYDDYLRLADTAVAVTAKITYMKPDYSTEGSPDYDAYVSYEYNGTKYENIEYRTYGNDDNYGKTVQIEIDPENPTTIRPHYVNTFSLVLLVCVMLFGEVSIHVFTVPLISYAIVSKRWSKIYKNSVLDHESINADIKFENRCKLLFSATLGVVFTILAILLGTDNYARTNTFTALSIYALALGAYLIFICCFCIRDIISTQGLIIVRDTLHNTKRELTDSDIEDRVAWEFTHCRRFIPNPAVCVPYGEITLGTIKVGTEVYLVLNKRNQIKRVYNATDFAQVQ